MLQMRKSKIWTNKRRKEKIKGRSQETLWVKSEMEDFVLVKFTSKDCIVWLQKKQKECAEKAKNFKENSNESCFWGGMELGFKDVEMLLKGRIF